MWLPSGFRLTGREVCVWCVCVVCVWVGGWVDNCDRCTACALREGVG